MEKKRVLVVEDQTMPRQLFELLIAGSEEFTLAAVNLVYNLTESRQQLINHFHRPFFKSLTQNCVIGICKCLTDNTPRFVPTKTFFVH